MPLLKGIDTKYKEKQDVCSCVDPVSRSRGPLSVSHYGSWAVGSAPEGPELTSDL